MKLIGKCKSLICIDNMNSYYDPELKENRRQRIENRAVDLGLESQHYSFEVIDLRNQKSVNKLVKEFLSVLCPPP